MLTPWLTVFPVVDKMLLHPQWGPYLFYIHFLSTLFVWLISDCTSRVSSRSLTPNSSPNQKRRRDGGHALCPNFSLVNTFVTSNLIGQFELCLNLFFVTLHAISLANTFVTSNLIGQFEICLFFCHITCSLIGQIIICIGVFVSLALKIGDSFLCVIWLCDLKYSIRIDNLYNMSG